MNPHHQAFQRRRSVYRRHLVAQAKSLGVSLWQAEAVFDWPCLPDLWEEVR